MVVRITRDDGLHTPMQVIDFDLMDRYAGWMWAWSLAGYALRKDEMVGSRRAYTAFRIARIERRQLDDTWQTLAPSHEPPA
jgi:hypothetical protein